MADAQPLAVGDEVEVDVVRVAHGGHFVARHEGQVLFVRHTAPGERVLARVTGIGSGGRFVHADTVEVITPAPERVAAPCRYAGDCGGCDFQHLSLAAQRDLKAAVVTEQFARLAGAQVRVPVQELGEATPGLRWRTRVEFAVDAAGDAGLRRHRSHEVVPLEDCLIAARGVVETGVLSRTWPGAVAVEVTSPGRGDPVVTPVPARRGPEGGAEAEQDAAPVLLVQEEVLGRDFEVAAHGFWQVHPKAAETFTARVLEVLAPQPGERALDLYAGVGLFAAALADAVGPDGQVIAVEADRLACLNAQANLGPWPHAAVLAGRVDDLFGVARPSRRGAGHQRHSRARKPRRSPLMPPSADLVVLDPPRTGAGPQVVKAIAGLAPRAIAYVACDPSALARDTKAFAEAGYALGEVTAYDAFPMTHHIECIAHFTPAP